MPTSCDISEKKASPENATLHEAATPKPLVDLARFCDRRFDIVIRYELLRKVDFDFVRADELFQSPACRRLRGAIARANPRLLRKGLFNRPHWAFVERRIESDPGWLDRHPYVISGHYGTSVKRLLLALKHSKTLPWTESPELVCSKPGFSRAEFQPLLSDADLRALESASEDLIESMRNLRFFCAESKAPACEQSAAQVSQQPLGFIIWQSGAQHIRRIIRCIDKRLEILDILRHPTVDREVFRRMMYGIYEIDPSNKDKVVPKIAALGDATSFLAVLCRGEPSANRRIKNSVRKLTGVNCIHSCDSKEITTATLRRLFSIEPGDIEPMMAKPRLSRNQIRRISSFLDTNIKVVGHRRQGDFDNFTEIIETLNRSHINYEIVHFGSPLDDQIRQGKDVELLVSDMTAAVDALGADYYKKNTVYKVQLAGRPLKLDFYYSLHLPAKWRNHLLANRMMGPDGYFVPRDVDKFWVYFYERVVLKPHKFRNEKRYPEGGGWNELILWGNRIGVYPRIGENFSHLRCRLIAHSYAMRWRK